jgi:ubiquinone/menaquinone biosynthesis C-methylase UbiE
MSKDATVGATSPRLFARQALVGRLYDWVLGRCYDPFMSLSAPGYRRTITRFYGQYLRSAGASRVLEVGPGTGYVTLVAARMLPSADLTCLDLSNTMLARLPQRLAGAGVARIPRLVQGDITGDTGLPANAYQLVVAQSIIEHVPDVVPALAEIHRVLEPGGTLLVSDICDGTFGRLYALLCQVRSFSRAEMREAAEAAGFEGLEFLDYEASFLMRGTLFFLQARKPLARASRARPGSSPGRAEGT